MVYFCGEIKKIFIWVLLYLVLWRFRFSMLKVNSLASSCNSCCLLCHLLVILKVIFANSMDPDQTAPRSSLIRAHTVCLYAKIGLKSLQEYSADGINRQHFQM